MSHIFWKMIYDDMKVQKNDLNTVAKGDKLKSHLVDCDILR